STNGAGLIHVYGTLKMDGGALYNGGTTDLGGAIKVKDGNVQLNGTLIANCWSNGATFSENRGGAMAILDKSKVMLTGCTIRGCSANEEGGAIYMDVTVTVSNQQLNGWMLDWTVTDPARLLSKFEESNDGILLINKSTISGCTASDEEGGAIHQDDGVIAVFDSSIRNCRAKSDDAGGIYQDKGLLFCRNVLFESNEADDEGGAICKNTTGLTRLINCTFKGNRANDEGGAIMQREEMLHLENCTLTGNAAAKKGGAIYVEDGSGVELGGKIIIRDNDGEDSFDNLVLEKGAYLYDQGLIKESEVHVVSSDSGDTYLTNEDHNKYKISETQQTFFVADKGTLFMSDGEQRNNQLQASAFSDGYYIVLAGLAVIVMAIIAGVVTVLNRRQKGK
nr:hypothetical protein [Clostridia bacterium]